MAEEDRAQNDARFSEVISRINSVQASISVLSQKVDQKPSLAGLIAVGVAGVGAIVGILAFVGDRFDGAAQVSSVSAQQAQEAQALAKENAEQIRALADIISKKEAE